VPYILTLLAKGIEGKRESRVEKELFTIQEALKPYFTRNVCFRLETKPFFATGEKPFRTREGYCHGESTFFGLNAALTSPDAPHVLLLLLLIPFANRVDFCGAYMSDEHGRGKLGHYQLTWHH